MPAPQFSTKVSSGWDDRRKRGEGKETKGESREGRKGWREGEKGVAGRLIRPCFSSQPKGQVE